MLTAKDILFTKPGVGSCVAYLQYSPLRKRDTLKYGKITDEPTEDTWKIADAIRLKEKVVYVLTVEAYYKIIKKEVEQMQNNLLANKK